MNKPGSIINTPYGEVRIGHFEEVLTIQGRYLNDHCFVRKGDEWHFFGIVGRSASATDDQPSGEISFAHATSPDLRHWTLHPEVMQRTGTWPEEHFVFAPYVIEASVGRAESKPTPRFHMLYCSDELDGRQRICLATSDDLFNWERYQGNPVIIPSLFWSKWPGFGLDAPDGGSYGGCRDPHIIRLPDGRFIAYWVSRLQEKFGSNLVCVAASISEDLIHWQEVGPVFSMKAFHRPLTMEVESPCVVFKHGAYWLFFKQGWWTHVVRSESPFDFHGCEPLRLGYSHASEVIEWNGEWYITHCKTDPDDYACERSDLSRGLFIGKLDWPNGGYPRMAYDVK